MGAGALNQTPLDWHGNQTRIVAALNRARAEGVTLLCLPEMCISGYGCEDTFLSVGVLEQSERSLAAILPHTRGLVVSLGLPVLVGHGVYNTAALVVDGQLVGLGAKRFLAGDGVHYEPRWWKAWPEGKVGRVGLLGTDVPIGDLVFDVGGVRIGFEICEDAWVASRPGAALARASVDVILNPSASHFAFDKLAVRRRFVIEGSRAFGAAYLYANLLGNDAGRVIYDGGPLVAALDHELALGRRLAFADDDLAYADVDVMALRFAQARMASYHPDPTAPGDRLLRVPFAWPEGPPRFAARGTCAAWETSADLKAEEFLRVEALALFDYLRKSRSQGFVVSLSGGCDSAAVAVLVWAAIGLAAHELGLDGVRARLPHIPGLARCTDVRALMAQLLTTVYQPTTQSSQVTRDAAAAVADAIGSRHLVLDVDAFVIGYVAAVEGTLGRRLRWDSDDLALQNVQARARGPGVWLIANVEGKLLLTTSNRSEAALGYATMDGDTCGGLAPLAGIDKAYLRRWLVWLQTQGCAELGPLPALAAVTSQRSTPELRPQSSAQFSEEDLMPFEMIDRIERLAIRDKLPPVAVLDRLWAESPQTDPARLAGWIERFFSLFARNQWKRERYAPSFHLDDENLDPKTWFRFPILSGGYVLELQALRERAAQLVTSARAGASEPSGDST